MSNENRTGQVESGITEDFKTLRTLCVAVSNSIGAAPAKKYLDFELENTGDTTLYYALLPENFSGTVLQADAKPLAAGRSKYLGSVNIDFLYIATAVVEGSNSVAFDGIPTQ